MCWGSYKNNRIGPDHRNGRSQCDSKCIAFEGISQQVIFSIEDRNKVFAIFSHHFNAHRMISDNNGTLRSPDTIYRERASEMYAWYRADNYYQLWAYLFANWYKPKQWKLWARSTCPDEIPVLRTTMIVENHWRRIKHDYLYRFSRPRIDLVVWTFLSRTIPQGIDKMKAIQDGNRRKAVVSWR